MYEQKSWISVHTRQSDLSPSSLINKVTNMSVRTCPICNTPSSAANLFLEENISPTKISVFSFASRKIPEYMCHRMVQCSCCDLVYVDLPPAAEALAEAYHMAEYDSTEEANDAALAYARAITPVLSQLAQREMALEIGTGTGVFLEHLSKAGFRKLVGIEPSTAAIAAAAPEYRGWIREGVFVESDFEPESFDLICCFMTLEHVRDPSDLARAAFRLLRPGGVFLTVTHDYRSLVNRLLGKKSPIIDIEHMQLFSRDSIKELINQAGFELVNVKSFTNRYSVRYWLKLAPLPSFIKNILSRFFELPWMYKRKLSLNVGNMLAWGFKGK
jgi:SAM-dependent methyltransferase